MIAFAACVGSPDKLARYAAPGLHRAMEPSSQFAELTTETSIHSAYNEALDHFSEYDDLEALVLLHEDLEIMNEDFCDRIRAELADPDVAIVGPVGARGVKGLAWWDGEISGCAVEPRGIMLGDATNREVDALDGMLLVLSPWAVRNLRCDLSYGGFHAYDIDLCFQARAAGRTVRTAPVDVYHHTKGGFGDTRSWAEADLAFKRKWSTAPAGRPAR